MESKKVLTTTDCGCQIIEREQIAGLSPYYYTIEYCPKHKAAEDMYEALKGVSPYLMTSDKMQNMNNVINAARRAIAKWEDK